ncbi:hypothetical protein F442_00757 [Phytophthora nicotianae P10297]|uniref:Uncharacterized protein n=4 Tax=Phytophthora nicotianae TaxID=4792 RepID=V9G174_PHYNI|nr:hypothetical protein F443_00806 [Phytophthora nicotianae P1569]ETK96597.1 hypothetical protein L915_00746 [Phytophthora nicotianae]ETO85541.1 hypothetical protein F444_00808 [Phytophthora nicotianae P1976]ETP54568.1 hypothetical protein F442_00757 [Phytophthora nicotianae P10297]ETM03031.1 hypothetical protein L917_00704 [Phytophthora nicotianae]
MYQGVQFSIQYVMCEAKAYARLHLQRIMYQTHTGKLVNFFAGLDHIIEFSSKKEKFKMR